MYLIKNNVFSVQFLMWHFKERLFDDMISIIQIIILMAKKTMWEYSRGKYIN